jgi:hypothetical protein
VTVRQTRICAPPVGFSLHPSSIACAVAARPAMCACTLWPGARTKPQALWTSVARQVLSCTRHYLQPRSASACSLQRHIDMYKWAQFKYLVHVDGLGMSSRCVQGRQLSSAAGAAWQWRALLCRMDQLLPLGSLIFKAGFRLACMPVCKRHSLKPLHACLHAGGHCFCHLLSPPAQTLGALCAFPDTVTAHSGCLPVLYCCCCLSCC